MYRVHLPVISVPPRQTLISLVLVNGADEAFAVAHTNRALAYWNELAPISPNFTLAQTRRITVDDPFRTHAWIRQSAEEPFITVVVIPNEDHRDFVDLGGGVISPAWNWPGGSVLYATTHTRPPYGEASIPDFLGMAIAHELGHARWAIPDRGNTDTEFSIMAYPLEAYRRWVMHPDDAAAIIAHETQL